jgi:tripartite-type tricarboxylate transporter receptor subunit TctC
MEAGRLKIIMQLGLDKHKELPNVPMLTDYVTKPDDRQVLDMIFSRQSMGRPLIAPPGTDPQVGEALRRAFTQAMHDPQFVAEGAKIDMELNYVSGADVQALVEKLYRSPPNVIARAQTIAAGSP